jgi:hypothetical protein
MHAEEADVMCIEGQEEVKGEVRDVYAHLSTSELLGIYERQQEELVKLSKRLEEITKKNIEISTSNLQQLQSLQHAGVPHAASPAVASLGMQAPKLSQLSLRVRQQSRKESMASLGVRRRSGAGCEGWGGVGAGVSGTQHAAGAADGDGVLGGAHDKHENALQGICTQEDAAAILMQMSRRMIDDP